MLSGLKLRESFVNLCPGAWDEFTQMMVICDISFIILGFWVLYIDERGGKGLGYGGLWVSQVVVCTSRCRV